MPSARRPRNPSKKASFATPNCSDGRKISRELHDQIAQTLTGINIHLAALKVEDAVNTKGLAKKIVSTQRLVEKSVDIVHRFARELRPTVLDDLGLIPALQSHIRDFTKRTHIPVRFTPYTGVEQLSNDKRTVLYRVIQAALTNIAQHAKADRVSLSIQKIGSKMCVEVRDNGKSFDVERVLFAKRHRRLGVLGMRERVEMVGGAFEIKSAPGKGTTIKVLIPFREDAAD
ncbi:sensor histidine kinase [Candidatus Sumerlaeota bacterium]|nr:sensor histidine kinase [Candidatus Sumerlaeota bacterium]